MKSDLKKIPLLNSESVQYLSNLKLKFQKNETKNCTLASSH